MSELIETLRGAAVAHRGLAVGDRVEVLCVSKRIEGPGWFPQFHLPVSGMVTVVERMEQYPRNGYKVEFQGRWGKLVGVRQGLTGMAVTLIVKFKEELWDLYTSIPTMDGVTEEEVRREATETVARMEQYRQKG